MKKILPVLIVLFMVASLVMAGTVAADGPGAKDKPGHGGKAADGELGDMEDFRMGQKGTVEGVLRQLPMESTEDLGLFQLTEKDGGCMHPIFSPDGSKIAYMYPYNDGNREIWVMELDFSSGTPVVVNDYNVTDAEDQCAHLEGWSPDGTKILFRSYNPEYAWPRDMDHNRLWIANANGSGVYELKAGVGNGSCFGGPTLYQASYSPDGSKIVYTMGYYLTAPSSNWSGKDIYVMDADGTGAVQLTDTFEKCELSPRWSPDGTKILYKKCDWDAPYDTQADLWVMNANGSSQQVVVAGVKANFFGWSPDGQWVVYEYRNTDSPSGYDRDIYKVRPDGSENTRMTLSDDYCEHTPLWGPDGTILYRSDELSVDGLTDLSSTWVMPPNSPAMMINPWGGMWHDWSPTGEWIAFQTCEPPTEYDVEQIYIMSNPLWVPPPAPPPVGGWAYPISKISILAPWIVLAVLLAGGISWLALRRRKAQN